jgi:glycine hydroxymethyltransferase
MLQDLKEQDKEIFNILENENKRQEDHLELIASENFTSRAVLEAYTSTLTNKYAEGYPGKRYYNGCQNADGVESLARERLKKLFSAEYANVQPHSGTQANMAVYLACLEPGDTFLGMNLSHGGHLTHGSKVNFSGRLYKAVSYGVREDTHRIDYDEMLKIAKEHKPKMIIAGASAYPRIIDFTKVQEIANDVGAKVLSDIAHIAGLIAGGKHPSPVGISDYITSTTHKTLRGPRGGFILSGKENEKILNSRVFPGTQGGPLMHVIAAKAVAFREALSDDFKTYIDDVVNNAKILAEGLMSRGYAIVSGGTDNHLMLMDTTKKGVTGNIAADRLEEAGITVNKNGIPFDPHPPMVTSGIRLGTPALTTRGFKADEFKQVANLICDILDDIESDDVLNKVNGAVNDLTRKFPMDKFRV